VRVALVEIDTLWRDPAGNRARLSALLPAADAAVLPEMAFTGFDVDAEPDAEAEPFLCRLARERAMWIAGGAVGPGPTNIALAVRPDGTLAARYAKLHPFSYAGEDRRFRRGDDLPVFDFGGIRAAAFVCYDLRFPEAFREAALRGAEIFLVIANWPARRVDHWKTLLRARAIENQAYVLGVNRIGRDPHEVYESSSLAVGPRGEVLHEGAGVVEVNAEAVRKWRAEFPALRDVRTDRYRLS